MIPDGVLALQLLRLVGLRSFFKLLEPRLLLLTDPCIKSFLEGAVSSVPNALRVIVSRRECVSFCLPSVRAFQRP